MVQIMLMLKIQDFEIEELFCGASLGSEHNLCFLGIEPVQDDFKHYRTWMAESSVFLEELKVAL